MDRKDRQQDHEKSLQDSSYRDDAPELVDSSDYAQGRDVGPYAGGGPGTSTESPPRPKGRQDWQQGSAPDDRPEADASPATADDPDNDVHSRSADPGQSSYGGFKNEGPSEQASHQKATDDDDRGPATTQGD